MTTLLPDLATARRTVLEVAAAPGRVHVRTSCAGDPATPCLRPMLLESGPSAARVALVPDGALLLAGDAIRLDVRVGRGTRLELVEPAGTVAFDMRGGSARWDVTIDLDTDAVLVWAGEPFVLAAGSRVRRRTTVRMAAGARLALRETLVLGRHRERGGVLDQTFAGYDEQGDPILVEQLTLDDHVHRPGVLGGRRAVGSVVALGIDVEEALCVDGRMDLERGGSVWRGLDHDAHLAVPSDAWRAVLEASRAPRGPRSHE
ncbi:MAG TPA: urease accessory protein UreD [Nocardioidaceae bacterium]|nr:urease accessory protein UreD [Nocardioidaceae bacterium]